MGRSGYLPDVSSAFSFWRSYAVNCLKDNNPTGASSGLNNINSLLTEDYIVAIDTEAYNRQTAENVFYQCGFCKKEIPTSKVKVCEILLSSFDSMISGKKKSRQWECPECKRWVSQRKTNIIKDKLESPFYRRVVTECPNRSIGLADRLYFQPKFESWFYNFLEELQHALALYRIEYIAQNGEDMADLGFKENGTS